MTTYTARPKTVYFIRPIGERGPIKIGSSMAPDKRCQQLQATTGKRLEIAAAVPGCMDDERRLQSIFWHDHLGGEWFRWSGALQGLVDIASARPIEFHRLPEARVRPMPGKRHPWTEDQKLRARYTRQIVKAQKATGRRFRHEHLGHISLQDTWKDLIPEIELFLAEAP